MSWGSGWRTTTATRGRRREPPAAVGPAAMTRRPPPPLAPSAEATLDLPPPPRTPLTSISLGLGLLDEGAVGPLTAAQRDVVRALVVDAARLALLVDGALQTDRLGTYAGPIERVAVDLGELLRAATIPISA